MKASLCSLLLWFASILFGFGNPLAYDEGRRPSSMLKEEVRVQVGPKFSEYHGQYLFQQLPDRDLFPQFPNQPKEVKDHVLIYVPVLHHYDRRAAAPTVFVDGVKIEERVWNDISLYDDPTGSVKGLPKNWSMFAFQYKVPLRRLKKTFEVKVSYRQENLPGDFAAYVPFNPPTAPGSATLTFIANEGYALKPFNLHFPWHRSYPSISEPVNHRALIRVKCLAKRR